MKELRYQTAFATDTGKIKPVNEDRGFHRVNIDEKGIPIVLSAVADGMGGLSAGEWASQTAIKYLNQWWVEKGEGTAFALSADQASSNGLITMLLDENTKLLMRKSKLLENAAQELEQIFFKINDALIYEGGNLGKRIGTTLSVFFLYGNDYAIVHIGDSRIYKVSNQVELLTEDHSWIYQQVQKGLLSVNDAKNHPSRHILTQCLGVNDKIIPFIGYGSLHQNELILVCSDGFYTMVEEEEWSGYWLESQKKSHHLQKAADTFVSLANQNGGHDNITVVLVKSQSEKRGILDKCLAWFAKD